MGEYLLGVTMQHCQCGTFAASEWLHLKYPFHCVFISSCVFACTVKVIKVMCVRVCMYGLGATKLNVGELGAHSLVDLVGIKMKRNVSKL